MLGASDNISVVIRTSLVQLLTPHEMLGRVSAVNSLFIGTSNQLGEFESGMTAALFGAVPAAALGGLGTIAVAFLWMALFPGAAARRYVQCGMKRRTTMKVAFLGLGVMGYPMAGHLAGKGGHAVTVYNRTAAKAEAWVKQHGGASAETPAEAADAARTSSSPASATTTICGR